jgi:hypothetical protein
VDVERHVITTSAPFAASERVFACRAPASRAKETARSAVRFQTVSGKPPAAIRFAIGLPMAPSPTNATLSIRRI